MVDAPHGADSDEQGSGIEVEADLITSRATRDDSTEQKVWQEVGQASEEEEVPEVHLSNDMGDLTAA